MEVRISVNRKHGLSPHETFLGSPRWPSDTAPELPSSQTEHQQRMLSWNIARYWWNVEGVSSLSWKQLYQTPPHWSLSLLDTRSRGLPQGVPVQTAFSCTGRYLSRHWEFLMLQPWARAAQLDAGCPVSKGPTIFRANLLSLLRKGTFPTERKRLSHCYFSPATALDKCYERMDPARWINQNIWYGISQKIYQKAYIMTGPGVLFGKWDTFLA